LPLNKGKIFLALGLKISYKNKMLGQDIELSAQNREDMRSGTDRRKFPYHTHIFSNRSDKERRNGLAI